MPREYKPRSTDASKFLNAMSQRKSRDTAAKVLEKVLSDDEIKERLKLRPQDLEVLDDIIVNPKRYSGNQLLALKLKIAATVTPPKQEVGVDGISVTINSYRREYELPSVSTTASLPGLVSRGDEDAEEEGEQV